MTARIDNFTTASCEVPEGEGGGPPPPHLKNHKLSNTGSDPKATKPAFNVVPSSACQRNAISMGFRWRADDGPFIVVFGSYLP